MKSIVLCERTLVHESEDFGTLKDGKVNKEEKEKKAIEKVVNGVCDGRKSEAVINNSSEAAESKDYGSNESSQSFKEEIGEGDGKQCTFPNDVENGASENSASNGMYSSVANARYNLCSDGDEKDRLVFETDLPTEDKITEGDAQYSSERLRGLSLNNDGDVSVINIKPRVETSQVDESVLKSATNDREVNNSLENSDNGSSEKSYASDIVEEKEESERSVLTIDADVDEDKENEKEGRRNRADEFPGNGVLSKQQSGGCEIQVGDVQSITGSEKDSMWADNDFKSSDSNLMETTGEKLSITSQDASSPNEGIAEEEKENQDMEMDESIVSETEENVKGMRSEEAEEEEESEGALEVINEEGENDDSTESDKLPHDEIVPVNKKKTKPVPRKKESGVCRKRHISEEGGTYSTSKKKKKRFSRDNEEEIHLQTEDENMEDSSRCEGSASPGQTSSEAGRPTTKRTSAEDKFGKKLRKPSAESKESKTKEELKFSILEKFRGSLKTLTRSDLEELIVQKLCEVITERSNVGELRRKAQALEQDQERWKTKVQSLTKQMREMEMVMKKYITEVQKQVKDGDTHVVTPLKVTRSVGLQVSFYSSSNKGPKSGLPPAAVPSSPTQNVNARNVKGTPPKVPSQFNPPNQNVRNKPITYQKGLPTVQKAFVGQQRRSIVPKPDYVSHRAMQQSLLSSSRGVQNQAPRATYKSISGTTAMTTAMTTATTTTATMCSSSAAQQPQQQQQNSSKVIDLTDDDDRQTGNVVKTPGPIRVVNHLSQAPATQNNRFAYLLPTTNSSTATSGGQSRQVLIATPTMSQSSRQIMCSMPPLLFKGGNVIQSGTQTHVVNQSNKVILPKALRHPAPLPQQPINQNTRPNLKLLPPRPALKISKVHTGIVLSWNMSLSSEHAPIASYQLYAYQESNSPPATSLWKKVGDVKALPLPMACTLTQFMSGHKYHFAVRAVDLHSRIGPFSFPGTIVLVK